MRKKMSMAFIAIAMLISPAFAGYGVYEWYQSSGGIWSGHWHFRGYVVSSMGGWVGCNPGGGPGGNGIVIVDETNWTGIPGSPGQSGGCWDAGMSWPCFLYFRPGETPQTPDPITALRLVETQPILTRQDYRLPILLSWFILDPVAATQYAHSRAFEGLDGAVVAATVVSQMNDEDAQSFIATLPPGNVRILVESWRGMGGRDMSEAWMQMHLKRND